MNIKKIIRKKINEQIKLNESGDDFLWVNDIEPNIFNTYKFIILDRKPTKTELGKIISDAKKYGIKNIDAWIEEEGYEGPYEGVIHTFNNAKTPYLRIDSDKDLMLGHNSNLYIKEYNSDEIIKFSELFFDNLNESIDDFDWIRNTAPTIDENNPPKEGDVLVCLPGYHSSPMGPYNEELDDPECAGAGYSNGRIIVAGEVLIYPNNPEGKRIIVWPEEKKSKMYWDYDGNYACFDCGVYGFALTYYTDTLNESEEDEWDWVRNTESSTDPYIGMKFKIISDPESADVVYTISDINDTHMFIDWVDPFDGGLMSNFRWPLKHYFDFVRDSGVEIFYGKLNESDELDWIRDTQHPIQIGDKYKTPNGNILTITDYYDDEGGIKIVKWSGWDIDDEFEFNAFLPEERFLELTNDNVWVKVNDSLNESDELDWIKDTNPTDLIVKQNDKVRIYNVGDEKAFIAWLGDFSNEYLDGTFYETIEGVVVDISEDTFWINPKNKYNYEGYFEIAFPQYTRIKSLTKNYPGLNLLYEII